MSRESPSRGSVVPADRDMADGWAAASNHVCRDTSAVVGKASPGPPESVSPGGTAWQLVKTCRVAVQGREVTAGAARAVARHTERISPSRGRFAL